MTKVANTSSKRLCIILHCGAPKTGTTSLAYHFHEHEDLLRKHGVFFPHRFVMRGDVDPLHAALVKSRRVVCEQAGVTEAKARLRDMASDPAIKTILVSNESILGEPFDKGRADFYPHAARVAPILKEIFASHDVTVSFVIRDFTSFLASYYVQLVKRGAYSSFLDFYRGLDMATLTWRQPVEALRHAFGADNVRVHDYSSFVQEPSVFLHTVFSASLGFNLPDMPVERGSRNQAVGGITLALMRNFNRIADMTGAGFTPTYRRRIRRYLVKSTRAILPGDKPRLPELLEQKLADQFMADQAVLLKTNPGRI